jgi:hypothetical protein
MEATFCQTEGAFCPFLVPTMCFVNPKIYLVKLKKMKIFHEEHTLLEGVSLITSNTRYDFVHLNKHKEIDSARVIEQVRIPSAELRLERFCEEWAVRLKRSQNRIFQSPENFVKIEEKIIAGLSGAVDKNFPEAMTVNEAKKISSKHGLDEYMSRITSQPLINKQMQPSSMLPPKSVRGCKI